MADEESSSNNHNGDEDQRYEMRRRPGWGAPHPECAKFTKKDFKVEDVLGRGSQGTIYKAHVLLTGTCAVKYMPVLHAENPSEELYRDAVRELIVSQKLSHHPNIVSFYGNVYDGYDKVIGFVSEFMEGGNLLSVINEWNSEVDPIDEGKWRENAVRWGIQIARAVAFCHSQNVLHRDIKPENALLTKDHRTIKLCDFGIARPQFATTSGPFVKSFISNKGTMMYIAPEVVSFSYRKLSTTLHKPADVYSFSMFLYTLFHRKHPKLDEESVHYWLSYVQAIRDNCRPGIDETLPDEIKEIIQDCWKTEPEERPTMREVALRLERFGRQYYPEENF